MELEPLLAFGSPIDAQVGPMPYTVVNTLFDPSFPTGALNYWKSSFVRELSDAAIDTMLAQFVAAPSPMTNMVLEPVHGAVTRVPVDATAVPHRDKSYNLVMTGVWMDPAATNENIAWTGCFRRPAALPGRPALRELHARRRDRRGVVRAAYGPNYDRLVELKTKYDPTNLFA
jgi:hypothetical protein